MKRIPVLTILAVLCLIVFSACAPKATPTPTPAPTPTSAAPAAGDLEAAARAFTVFLQEGKYADAYAMFDSQMAAAMNVEKLKATMATLGQQVGALKGIKEVQMRDESGYRMAYVTCDFALTPLDIKIVFNAQGRISGLWFVPAGSGGT